MQLAHTVLFDTQRNPNLSIHQDADEQVLYFAMNVRPRPCFTWDLIRDLLTFQQHYAVKFLRNTTRPRCLVWASASPGIFSLGGDLALFQSVIEKQDYARLSQYAEDCVTVLYNHLTAADMVTISLLEGDALGAGLEVALSSDIVVAERGIRAGFPEILFNLVPGHGAYYLLARRIGAQAAEKMIRQGAVHSVEELHALGLVDILVDKGEGRRAIRLLLDKERKSWNAFQALQHIKRQYLPITRDMLMASAHIWVDAAMRLTERNLRMMARLVHAQEKRAGLAAVPEVTMAQQDAHRIVA